MVVLPGCIESEEAPVPQETPSSRSHDAVKTGLLSPQSLVDLEDFVHVLRAEPQPPEGSHSLPEWPPQLHPGAAWRSHEAAHAAGGAAPAANIGTPGSNRHADQSSSSAADYLAATGRASSHRVPAHSGARTDQQEDGSAQRDPLSGSHPGGHSSGTAASSCGGAIDHSAVSGGGGSRDTANSAAAHIVSSSAAMAERSLSGAGGQQHSTSEAPRGLHVEFRDVSFSYGQPPQQPDPADNTAESADGSAAAAGDAHSPEPMQLRGVSFTVQPGESIGIVGPPGDRPRKQEPLADLTGAVFIFLFAAAFASPLGFSASLPRKCM